MTNSARVLAIGSPEWQQKVVAAAQAGSHTVETSSGAPLPSVGAEDVVLLQWKCQQGDQWAQLLDFLKAKPQVEVVVFPGEDDPPGERAREATKAGWPTKEIAPGELADVLASRWDELVPGAKPPPRFDKAEFDSLREEVAEADIDVRYADRVAALLRELADGNEDLDQLVRDHLDVVEQFVRREIATRATERVNVRDVVARGIETFCLAKPVPRDVTQEQLNSLADIGFVETNEGFLLSLTLMLTVAVCGAKTTIPHGAIEAHREPVRIHFQHGDLTEGHDGGMRLAEKLTRQFRLGIERDGNVTRLHFDRPPG